MEIGADVWIKDFHDEEAWLAGIITGKVQINI
jgi:hypothetical protein